MGRTGKTPHICADLRQNDLCTAPPNAGKLIDCCYGGFIFRHIVFDHSVQYGNPFVQIINVVKNLGEQFALQRGHNALNRGHNLRQLGKHPAMDQARSFIGIRQVIGNDPIKQLSGTDPVNILDNAGQFW